MLALFGEICGRRLVGKGEENRSVVLGVLGVRRLGGRGAEVQRTDGQLDRVGQT